MLVNVLVNVRFKFREVLAEAVSRVQTILHCETIARIHCFIYIHQMSAPSTYFQWRHALFSVLTEPDDSLFISLR